MIQPKVPRFESLQPSSEKASKAKRGNKALNTKAEVMLRKALWKRGARYRLHVKQLVGKPDIVFPKQMVAIFIDGDFWHGRNWIELRRKLSQGSNAVYWIAKIQYNRSRDRRQTKELEKQGWLVIRLWETDVAHNVEKYADKIMLAVYQNT